MPFRPLLLIIDDNPDNIEVLGETLADIAEVGFALSGAEALAQMANSRPDLILLDLMMPDMDGFEVIDTLKRDPRLRGVPVIFVTAKNDSENETRGLAAGAVDFIHKPINREVTRARVGVQLDLLRQRNEMEALNRQLADSLEQNRIVQREVERARLRELEIGAAIQQQLLFGLPPAGLAGYDVACYSEPSQGVDGDFYTFTQLGPASFEVLAGDVMGKGVTAALIAAGINNTYRRVFAEMLALHPGLAPSPAALINAIHHAVTPQLIEVGAFVTLALLRFDQATRTVTWVNAGHTPTLLLPAGGAAVRELLGDNLPLGVIASESYAEHVTPCLPGDTLLLYSDGVSEALDAGGAEYGSERLRTLFAQTCPAPPAQILERLRADLHEYTGSTKGADDRSAIIVRASTMA